MERFFDYNKGKGFVFYLNSYDSLFHSDHRRENWNPLFFGPDYDMIRVFVYDLDEKDGVEIDETKLDELSNETFVGHKDDEEKDECSLANKIAGLIELAKSRENKIPKISGEFFDFMKESRITTNNKVDDKKYVKPKFNVPPIELFAKNDDFSYIEKLFDYKKNDDEDLLSRTSKIKFETEINQAIKERRRLEIDQIIDNQKKYNDQKKDDYHTKTTYNKVDEDKITRDYLFGNFKRENQSIIEKQKDLINESDKDKSYTGEVIDKEKLELNKYCLEMAVKINTGSSIESYLFQADQIKEYLKK